MPSKKILMKMSGLQNMVGDLLIMASSEKSGNAPEISLRRNTAN